MVFAHKTLWKLHLLTSSAQLNSKIFKDSVSKNPPVEGYALIVVGKHTCARYVWNRSILPCQSVNPSVLFGVATTDDKGSAETPTKGTQLDKGNLEVRWGSVVWYG